MISVVLELSGKARLDVAAITSRCCLSASDLCQLLVRRRLSESSEMIGCFRSLLVVRKGAFCLSLPLPGENLSPGMREQMNDTNPIKAVQIWQGRRNSSDSVERVKSTPRRIATGILYNCDRDMRRPRFTLEKGLGKVKVLKLDSTLSSIQRVPKRRETKPRRAKETPLGQQRVSKACDFLRWQA
jgi:hypothetical protein